MTNKIAPITPTKEEQRLIDTIRLEIEQGKQEIHKVVEDVRTRRYWTIGKHIKTYLLDYEDRAEYGKHLFELLEQEFGIERSTLHRTVKFFEAYPQIVAGRPQLSWTHYKTLIAIPDEEQRQLWEEKAVKEHISAEDLQILVTQDKA